MESVETSLVDTVEEEIISEKRRTIMLNRNQPANGNIRTIIREELSLLKWVFGMLLVIVALGAAGYFNLDSKISDLSEQLDKKMTNLTTSVNASVTLSYSHMSDGHVYEYAAGTKLTEKGEALVKQESMKLIFDTLNEVYRQDPTTLPISAPVRVYERLEENNIDIEKIAEKNDVLYSVISSVIVVKANEIHNSLVAAK